MQSGVSLDGALSSRQVLLEEATVHYISDSDYDSQTDGDVDDDEDNEYDDVVPPLPGFKQGAMVTGAAALKRGKTAKKGKSVGKTNTQVVNSINNPNSNVVAKHSDDKVSVGVRPSTVFTANKIGKSGTRDSGVWENDSPENQFQIRDAKPKAETQLSIESSGDVWDDLGESGSSKFITPRTAMRSDKAVNLLVRQPNVERGRKSSIGQDTDKGTDNDLWADDGKPDKTNNMVITDGINKRVGVPLGIAKSSKKYDGTSKSDNTSGVYVAETNDDWDQQAARTGESKVVNKKLGNKALVSVSKAHSSSNNNTSSTNNDFWSDDGKPNQTNNIVMTDGGNIRTGMPPGITRSSKKYDGTSKAESSSGVHFDETNDDWGDEATSTGETKIVNKKVGNKALATMTKAHSSSTNVTGDKTSPRKNGSIWGNTPAANTQGKPSGTKVNFETKHVSPRGSNANTGNSHNAQQNQTVSIDMPTIKEDTNTNTSHHVVNETDIDMVNLPAENKRKVLVKNGNRIVTNPGPRNSRAWSNQPKRESISSGRRTPVKEVRLSRDWSAIEIEPVLDTDRLGKKFPFLNASSTTTTTSEPTSASATKPNTTTPKHAPAPTKAFENTTKIANKAKTTLKDDNENPQIFYGFGVGRFRKYATAWLAKFRTKKSPVESMPTVWN